MLEYLEFSFSTLEKMERSSSALELHLEGTIHVWEDDEGKAGRANVTLSLLTPARLEQPQGELQLPMALTSGELSLGDDYEAIVPMPSEHQQPCRLTLVTEAAPLHFEAAGIRLRRTSNIWNLQDLDQEYFPRGDGSG